MKIRKMKITILILLFSDLIYPKSNLEIAAAVTSDFTCIDIYQKDTLKDNQLLYTGKIWRNKYSRVKEDQFLFSTNFLKGSVTIDGEQYKGQSLRYDIYNDEIMALTYRNLILQLNKEVVESFTLDFENQSFTFAKIQSDTLSAYSGYFYVLYKGKSSLYVKFRKEIDPLAVDKKYDRFFQTQKIYFTNNDTVYPLAGKGDLLRLLVDYKQQLKSYIKGNKLSVSKKIPESFVPVVTYYDKIRK
jgi:hypothetical protein